MKMKIPSYFQPFTYWKDEAEVQGDNVGLVIADLFRQFPELKPHFYTYWGILSANVLIYINQDEIFTRQGLDTPVQTGDMVRIVPTVSGG
jgi:molybdopterin converting factor small subunit